MLIANRQYRKVVAFAVLGCVLGAGISFFLLSSVALAPTTAEVVVTKFTRSAPVTLHIPKLKIETAFETPLGLNDDQTIEVPDSYEQVGWYKHGATPGEIGSAVVLGHVDSFEGPAVFFSLSKLEKGDVLEIEREDGTTAKFEVEEIGRYAREDFPTERVYGASDTAVLRLVTCTGIFNKGKQEYSHNLVVYAKLIEESE